MRAFVVGGEDGPALENIAVPAPQEGEALVRILRAGICNTDIEILSGYMGFAGVVGHEFVGVVQEVNCGPDSDDGHLHPLVGKRVVGEINLACCRCNVCDAGGHGARNHCPHRTVLGILGKHGTYAEFLTLPCRNLHVVPVNVSDAAAVFAEPLAAACRILEQGLAHPDATVAVLGDGKLGLLIAEVLSRRALADQTSVSRTGSSEGGGGEDDEANGGAVSGRRGTTTLIGRHEDKMNLCCSKAAPDEEGTVPTPRLMCVDATNKSSLASLASSFDVVVDATGSPQGLECAVSLCRPLGTIVLKSTCAAGEAFNPAPVVINEQRIVGSRCGPFDAALGMLASAGGIDVERYITGVYPLAEVDAALEAARTKGALKVQIVCSAGEGI